MERTLATRLREVRHRMAAAAAASGRSEDSVTLVAISKGHPVEALRAAAQLGVEHFGENYLQEALPKIESLRDMELTWHFTGRVQANKTRPVAEHFSWVHGVDRLKIAERLSAQRGHYAPPLNVCLQVNIAHDDNKAGVAADAVPEQLEPAAAATAMRGMRRLLADLQRHHATVDTLSMGMSGDYEAAIRAGSTMVRIGTALFGPRASLECPP